jgi:hypothetical protein
VLNTWNNGRTLFVLFAEEEAKVRVREPTWQVVVVAAHVGCGISIEELGGLTLALLTATLCKHTKVRQNSGFHDVCLPQPLPTDFRFPTFAYHDFCLPYFQIQI